MSPRPGAPRVRLRTDMQAGRARGDDPASLRIAALTAQSRAAAARQRADKLAHRADRLRAEAAALEAQAKAMQDRASTLHSRAADCRWPTCRDATGGCNRPCARETRPCSAP